MIRFTMYNHCLVSLTIIVIAAISNQAFILQCQNCRCIPDYCLQTVPRSLCPCDGPKAPCSQAATGMQTVLGSAINVHQQPFVITQPPATKYFLIQQPIQSVPAQIPGQLIIENQQHFMQVLSSLQQQMLTQQVRMETHQPTVPPVYVIRTIEQPAQIVRQVQQIPEPMLSSQYLSAVQQVPMLQTQMMIVPSVQQVIPPTQQFVLPFQVPTQTVTLQVPVTMAEHCTPRTNACPLGLPSIHAVTECDNITDSTVQCYNAITFATFGAPKNTTVNVPSVKKAGYGILPNIAQVCCTYYYYCNHRSTEAVGIIYYLTYHC